MKRLFILLVSILILSSCALHNGMIQNSVCLSEANYRFVQTAEGTATATYVFGIGGLGKDGLAKSAKKDMMRNYPLKENQAYSNLSYDHKRSFLFILIVDQVTITADIVEFNSES